MLNRFLSQLRPSRPVKHAVAPTARPRALSLETLEGREVPAIIFALDPSNNLLRFDSTAPGTVTTIAVTGLGAGETLEGIDFRPRTGQLYAVSVPAASTAPQILKTYTINPTTGAATVVGQTAATVPQAAAVATGYDFNPTVDRIRYVNENNENARLNPNNGALAGDDTNLTFTSPATGPLVAVAYDRNTDRQGTTIPTTLYAIDRGTSSLVTIGSVDGTVSPNGGVVTTVGVLGVTLSATNDAGFDIVEATGAASTLNNNGKGIAYAALTVGTTTGLYAINLTTGTATLVGSIGTGATEIRSLTAVPEGVVVVGSGLGANGDVRLLDPVSGAIRGVPIVPFVGFQGGVRVATGDVTGDGVPDAIVTAVQAVNGHIKVFDGITGAEVRSFFSFQGFAGSVNVASGDVNGDGYADILVVANGASGHVKVFSGLDGSVLDSFLSYDGFFGNVTIAAGDFDNNGSDEIVTSAAINGHTKVFNGTTGALFTTTSLPSFQSSFFAFSPYLGDVSVAVGDVTGDGIPDLVLASGAGVRLNVRAVNGSNGAQLSSFFVDNFGTGFTGGGSVAVSDFNRDGKYEIAVTPGIGTQSTVFALDPLTGSTLGNFTAFGNFQGGATVAGTRF